MPDALRNLIDLLDLEVLEADATFANSTNDLALFSVVEDNAGTETDLEIGFITETESVSGTFTSIELFVAGAAKLIGSSADDHFGGDDGVNVFEGLQGNDLFDGAGGSDTAIFANPIADYTITRTSNGFEVIDTAGDDGQDTLISIERLKFSDIGIAYDLDTSAGQVAKLLGATFGRKHVLNPKFVGIGLELLDDGMTYEELAELAIKFAGGNTPQKVVTQLWTNVIGSPPTTQQARPFVDLLNNNDVTTGELVVFAAETNLNATNINLVGLSNTGIEFI